MCVYAKKGLMYICNNENNDKNEKDAKRLFYRINVNEIRGSYCMNVAVHQHKISVNKRHRQNDINLMK